MLPKEKRLANTNDYKRVYQKGSFFSSRLLVINYLANKTSASRLGIVVTKKVAPKAVDRNKVKRKFREASRSLYDVLPAGYDVVVNIKKSATSAPFTEIKKEISEAFEGLKKKEAVR